MIVALGVESHLNQYCANFSVQKLFDNGTLITSHKYHKCDMDLQDPCQLSYLLSLERMLPGSYKYRGHLLMDFKIFGHKVSFIPL
jgi:hypothetical protein